MEIVLKTVFSKQNPWLLSSQESADQVCSKSHFKNLDDQGQDGNIGGSQFTDEGRSMGLNPVLAIFQIDKPQNTHLWNGENTRTQLTELN